MNVCLSKYISKGAIYINIQQILEKKTEIHIYKDTGTKVQKWSATCNKMEYTGKQYWTCILKCIYYFLCINSHYYI